MQNFKPLAIFCDATAQFVSDLVGNPEDRFSLNEVHIQTIQLYNIKGIHDILILKLQNNNNSIIIIIIIITIIINNFLTMLKRS